MMAIIVNDLARLWQQKARIVLNVAITAGMILVALFFARMSPKASPVVLVTENGGSTIQLSGYAVTAMKNAPALSALVSGKYDAVVTGTATGGYSVTTLKNADYGKRLSDALAGRSDPAAMIPSRGAGSTIAGFLLMFILLQGTLTLYLFADDKELKILPRISSTPISISRYLAAHSIFTLLSIVVSDLAILYAIRFITGADIGFSFAAYALLFSVAGILSTGFALFLNAIATKGDTANMAGSAIVTLTSVLAGSFYSFERGNPLLEAIVKTLPQKSWLDSATLIERGLPLANAARHLVYPLALALLLGALALAKTKRDYVGRA